MSSTCGWGRLLQDILRNCLNYIFAAWRRRGDVHHDAAVACDLPEVRLGSGRPDHAHRATDHRSGLLRACAVLGATHPLAGHHQPHAPHGRRAHRRGAERVLQVRQVLTVRPLQGDGLHPPGPGDPAQGAALVSSSTLLGFSRQMVSSANTLLRPALCRLSIAVCSNSETMVATCSYCPCAATSARGVVTYRLRAAACGGSEST